MKSDLAYVHFVEQQYYKAIKEYKEILKLNKLDNQGVRFNLANILLIARRFDEFEELTKEFIHIRLQDTTVKKEHNNWLKTYNLI